ncbi:MULTISPECIES: glycosyltransferase family 2 protein [Clostridium]|uniref:Beta-monoglucosyldiacylglycerol synthase n=3 Tax=Clostridium TaxID=1485 RepID=D8GRF8_CLOLD|nr:MULTISPECIES: glycosyltransferase family 2 protein [Clostridium]ADK14296.1 predicted glycosyltransferase [Clostridium ljungdahlii DSM 13528]AGY77513.1 glycosyltransferase [Clostridium autoethanogenum DSM 10061]ALU37654.1 Glycosyl transferase group 2 family protein [Clostridium autoethanogenum DSM 10061]OAA88283.1 Beta-monoglucosyldiacylglycerol synthase [Clostridium ljungdahlii DSM 13528]OVY49995.1 Beta-monoglucosyldiacylglycerol synthase [Clostridium autoethanogenum]
MSIFKELIHNASRVLTYTVYIISIYYLFISIFGIRRKKDTGEVKPEKSFALVVAAHNEEVVIDDIIESLKKLDYPKALYDIFVIADNCTDKTALKARKKGAIVYERFTEGKRGKGYALEWMFDKIFKMKKKYDAVAIFDADNLVNRNFLKEMNKQLCKGYKVVQGYLDSKNPCDTWITGSYSIAFWTCNRMFQLARSNLGLSTQLGGTGFCIDITVLKKLGWGATCLTEDLEFTCKLVLHGYKVGWAHDAIIYDEKPLTLFQSWKQRKRWMQGFADVSSRYFFKLLIKSIKSCNFVLLDCAFYSIQPIVTVLIGISAISGVIQYFMKTYNLISNFNTVVYSINFDLFTIIAVLFSILQFVYTPFVLILEKKLDLRIFGYYIIYPLYVITWFPISLQGIIYKNDKEWNHTIHSRSVKIKDLEKAN